MNALISAFFDICRLRTGPQDLPASSMLLVMSLLVYMAINALLSALSLPADLAIFSALLDTVLMLLLCGLVLRLAGRAERLPQTLTALAGSGSLLAGMAIPLLLWRNQADANFGDVTLPGLAILVLVIWNIVVIGHIFRSALSTLMSIGVLLALFYFWLQVRVVSYLLPLPA